MSTLDISTIRSAREIAENKYLQTQTRQAIYWSDTDNTYIVTPWHSDEPTNARFIEPYPIDSR